MIKHTHFIMWVFISLGLISCGGSDTENGYDFIPTDPNTVFSLFPAGYFNEGYSETYNLNGSDTAGGIQTGSYSIQTQAQSIFNSDAAIPFSVILSITNTQTGAFATASGTGYYSANQNDLRNLGYDSTTTGVVTVSAITSTLPLTGKINDFGDIGEYTDSAGEKDVDTWRLRDAGNGKAKLTYYSTSFDQFGSAISTSEETYVINPDGTRNSLEFKLYYPGSGITITLNGNKT